MSRVLTNNVGLQYAIESSTGVLPGSPTWFTLEPNNVGAYGAQITTVERRPISKVRGRRKGVVVNLESSVEFDADITMSSFEDFAEGFVFAEFANVEFDFTAPKLNGAALDTDTTGDTFDLSSGTLAAKTNGTLLVSKLTWTSGQGRSLLWARGYANAANNGLHELSAQPAGGDSGIAVTTNLVTETAPANAKVGVAGVRVSDADLTLTVTGGLTATLVSGADITDWSALGLLPGQEIHIGSADANGAVQNAMSDSVADDVYGYARVTSISGATLNLDKLDPVIAAVSSADNSGTGDADIMFGRFLRNVDVDADSDDERYLERTYQIEASYPDLGGVGTPEYEYAIGNFANELQLQIPLNEKATATWGFIGTNTDDITPTRKTNAASAQTPIKTAGIGTASDIVSLSSDVVSSASDVCFKSLNISINENVSPEQCIGTLGAAFVNAGLFEVNLEGQMLFTNKAITNAIKNNTTVTFQAIMRNQDGGVCLDLPALTFGNGQKEYPVDASVLVNITGLAFNDPTGTIPDVSLGISFFESVPYA